MAVSYKHYIKVGRYYVRFEGPGQTPVYVGTADKAESFTTESLAKAKARYKNIKDFKIEKVRVN